MLSQQIQTVIGYNETNTITLLTSDDGQNWAPSASSVGGDFSGGEGLAVAADGSGNWVAGGYSTTTPVRVLLYSSNNGQTWTDSTYYGLDKCNAVAVQTAGTGVNVNWIAGGTKNSAPYNTLAYSTTSGTSWTNITGTPFGSGECNAVVYSNANSYFVAGGNDSTNIQFANSDATDITSWTSTYYGLPGTCNSIIQTPTHLVAGVTTTPYSYSFLTSLSGDISWNVINDPLFTNGGCYALANNANSQYNTVYSSYTPSSTTWTNEDPVAAISVFLNSGNGITKTPTTTIIVGEANYPSTNSPIVYNNGSGWTPSQSSTSNNPPIFGLFVPSPYNVGDPSDITGFGTCIASNSDGSFILAGGIPSPDQIATFGGTGTLLYPLWYSTDGGVTWTILVETGSPTNFAVYLSSTPRLGIHSMAYGLDYSGNPICLFTGRIIDGSQEPSSLWYLRSLGDFGTIDTFANNLFPNGG